jgi:hypothetical protein
MVMRLMLIAEEAACRALMERNALMSLIALPCTVRATFAPSQAALTRLRMDWRVMLIAEALVLAAK